MTDPDRERGSPEDLHPAISIEFPCSRTVTVSLQPTTDADFEHLRDIRYRWMRLRCVETGQRSNQVVSHDISLDSVIFYAERLALRAGQEGWRPLSDG